MTPRIYPDYKTLFNHLCRMLYERGNIQKTDKWQGAKIEDRTSFLELLHIAFQFPIPNFPFQEIQHNEAWASEHFRERIGGLPLNPGKAFKNWPFYKNIINDKFRTEEKFTHTYMERIWCKYAGLYGDADMERLMESGKLIPELDPNYNRGIRYPLGDLADLVKHLQYDPFSRQGYLPIWFPEDTGAVHGGRVPCSIGYFFINRGGFLHCTYQLRSCDLLRHFADDMVLASMLTWWIVENLNDKWEQSMHIKPGMLNVTIGSLHIFEQEKNLLNKYYGQD